MAGRRPPKKSDPLVVRMPHEDKEAFLDACRRNGRTASDVVRDLVAGYVRRAEVRARLREIQPERSLAMILRSPKTRIAAAASAAAGALAVVALTTPSVAAYDYRTSFNMLDVDGDGAISMDEYAGGGSRSTIAMEFGPPPVGSSAAIAENAGAGPQESEVVLDFTYDIGFGVSDGDGDGSVDFDEFVRRHEQLLARQFALQDADGNGQLSSLELIGQVEPHGLPAAVFVVLDHNEDGAITLREFQDGPAL